MHIFSKPANLDGLEVDQYIWSILEDPRTADCEEVTIDQYANMMPCATAKVSFFDDDDDEFKNVHFYDGHFQEGSDDLINAGPLSPGSLKLPSLASWDLPTTTRSPALYTPPDINSKFDVF